MAGMRFVALGVMVAGSLLAGACAVALGDPTAPNTEAATKSLGATLYEMRYCTTAGSELLAVTNCCPLRESDMGEEPPTKPSQDLLHYLYTNDKFR